MGQGEIPVCQANGALNSAAILSERRHREQENDKEEANGLHDIISFDCWYIG
jgi:hypothetical protein